MSALRWLEAGVTASYGTVTEPCASAEKFPLAHSLEPKLTKRTGRTAPTNRRSCASRTKTS
jgi:hypothetical protein